MTGTDNAELDDFGDDASDPDDAETTASDGRVQSTLGESVQGSPEPTDTDEQNTDKQTSDAGEEDGSTGEHEAEPRGETVGAAGGTLPAQSENPVAMDEITVHDIPTLILDGLSDTITEITAFLRETTLRDIGHAVRFTASEVTPERDADLLEKGTAVFVYTVLLGCIVLFVAGPLLL